MKLLSTKFPLRIAGGKAFRLSTLTRAGFPVKPGYVMTIAEVVEVAQKASVKKSVLKIASHLNHSDSIGLAVRSSAVGEDGTLSWAGQFTSKLFVKGQKLFAAIVDCAGAVKQETVSKYAALHQVAIPKLALIIQEMVNARVAGVLFTSHPLRRKHGVMVIEVTPGTSELMVSGQLEPHRYYVDEKTGKVLKEEGAQSPLLNKTEVDKLIRLGAKLRAKFGKDQDVEWAIEKGTERLFINQARNVTSRHGASAPVSLNRRRVIKQFGLILEAEEQRLRGFGCKLLPDVLSNQNIEELLTDHPSAMAFGLFTHLFAHGKGGIAIGRNEIGYGIGEELETGFFRLVAGRPRCSIIHDAFTYRIRAIPLTDYCRLVNHYLVRISKDSQLANYPEVVLYEQNPSKKFLVEIFSKAKADEYLSAYRVFFSNIRRLEHTLVRKYQSRAAMSWTKALVEQHLSREHQTLSELRGHYLRVCEIMRTVACPTFVKVARLGFFAYARLRNLVGELFSKRTDEYLGKLTSGIPRELNPNLEFGIHLYEYKCGKIPFGKVVQRYGHLAQHELEISVPRYRDQPTLLEQLALKTDSDPEKELEKNRGSIETF